MKKYKDIQVGDIVYLRCNPDIVPKGYLKLKIKEGKDGRLIGQDEEDSQKMKYDIIAWYSSLEFKKPKNEN